MASERQMSQLPSQFPSSQAKSNPLPVARLLVIIITLLTTNAITLILLIILAGHSASSLSSFSVLSLNTTALKVNSRQVTAAGMSAGIPIHDVYSVFMTNSCAGYYEDVASGSDNDVQWECGGVSAYSKFDPLTLMLKDIEMHTQQGANTTSVLNLPSTIQTLFTDKFNLRLHVAFIFYVISLVVSVLILPWAVIASPSWRNPKRLFPLWLDNVFACFIWTHFVSLLVATVLVTTITNRQVYDFNKVGTPVGISAYFNKKLLGLGWGAVVTSLLGLGFWGVVFHRARRVDNEETKEQETKIVAEEDAEMGMQDAGGNVDEAKGKHEKEKSTKSKEVDRRDIKEENKVDMRPLSWQSGWWDRGWDAGEAKQTVREIKERLEVVV